MIILKIPIYADRRYTDLEKKSRAMFHASKFNWFNLTPTLPPHPITKTRLYNFDPLKPHFYVVKLGSTGVYIIYFAKKKTEIVDTR